MSRNFSTSAKLSLSVLILLLFVCGLELFLRLAGVDTFVENRFFVLNRALDYPELFQKDRELFWRLRPSQQIRSRFFDGKKIRINSLGLRGDEVASDKTNRRIVAIGNSCTFGWGVPVQTIFTTLLNRRLGGDWESINAGLPGYSSFQGKKFLESDILELEPDILLVMFGWNDHWAAASQIADKDQQFPSQTVIALQNNLARLHTYRLLKKGWLNLIEQSTDSTFDRERSVYRVGLRDFRTNLNEICRIAKSNNILPALLTSPIPSLDKYYPRGMTSPLHRKHEQYNQMIRAVALENDILLVDLNLEFEKADQLWDNPANDPIHFNARGHVLAALTIATRLKRAGLVD